MADNGAAKIPRLCKYRSMEEGKTREYTLAILRKQELRYSPASTFNDPFDCNLAVALKSTAEVEAQAGTAAKRGYTALSVLVAGATEKLGAWMESKGAKLPPRASKAAQVEPTPEVGSKPEPSARLVIRQQGADGRWRKVSAGNLHGQIQSKRMAKMHPILDKSFGVLCLSERPDDILLWSHYGSNHRGLVLEFDAAGHPAAFRRLHKVVYQKPYPFIAPEFPDILEALRDKATGMVNETLLSAADQLASELSSDTTEMTPERRAALSLARWFYVKSSFWSYEREWRCLKWQPGPQPFPPAALARIIAGCTNTDETLALVRGAIAGTAIQDVPLFKAVRRARKFGLDIVPAG